MTSTNQPETDATPDYTDKLMRHPDLGDTVAVPWFAVEGHLQRGYEIVEDADQPVDETVDDTPQTVPAPTGATSTRARTSGPAKTPGSDDGTDAVNPAV